MNMKDFLKPRAWLPCLIGLLIGLVLFVMGEKDDAPGLVLIGLIVAIVLVFYGIYNVATGAKKGLIPSILCFFLSAFGIVWMLAVTIEGEFGDSPGVIIFAGLICIGLLIVGIRLLKNKRAK